MTQREFQRPSVNFLQSASNVVILGGSFTGVEHNHETKETSAQRNNGFLEPLHKRVSSNAILNAGGRADHVRCHPGTREEVIRIIEKWIDGDGELSRCIFWLSGPAGAGKTAIIQTIAEQCIQRSVPMANYFFFRADPTRNHTGSVAATLLYQILQFYPALKTNIATLLDAKPLVLDQSIRDQFEYLLDIPVRTVVDSSAPAPRLVLLIDGLDECSHETKHVQKDLLHALHHLGSQQDSPFAVLVASRAEPHLVMTFNEIRASCNSIFLNEDYHPSHDIRLFVAAEFDKVKRTHHLGEALGDDWPSKGDINDIVDKSSGQFIYAATVMRFISSSSASPEHSLERVRGIRPIVKSSPFAELDAIYTHILSQAEDWDSAKDILASELILPKISQSYQDGTTRSRSDIESYLADLVAIVRYNAFTGGLSFYHASFPDFLCDKSRSRALYVDLDSFTAKIASGHILHMSSFYNVELFCRIFSQLKAPTPLLTDALLSWKPWQPETLHGYEIQQGRVRALSHICLVTLSKLYYKDNYSFYQTILHKWLTWLADLKIPLDAQSNVFNYDTPQASQVWIDICKSRRSMPGPLTQNSEKVAFWKRLV